MGKKLFVAIVLNGALVAACGSDAVNPKTFTVTEVTMNGDGKFASKVRYLSEEEMTAFNNHLRDVHNGTAAPLDAPPNAQIINTSCDATTTACLWDAPAQSGDILCLASNLKPYNYQYDRVALSSFARGPGGSDLNWADAVQSYWVAGLRNFSFYSASGYCNYSCDPTPLAPYHNNNGPVTCNDTTWLAFNISCTCAPGGSCNPTGPAGL